MKVIFYAPGQPPRDISPDGFELPSTPTGFARVTSRVVEELGCPPHLIDVQACGPGFVAYTIADHEGEPNELGMLALAKATGYTYSVEDDDTVICGPVLIVTI
ncbi:hypothetical protein [Hymenobacter sp. BRD67]|uniref:hypothetical protein n=1 Tax=Hymenobacter sp. BRD67 TaxID=2675877 RepID=UPI001563201D|nr:hypothetical protein [Hymenobacter sp. BRD67]QKG52256.1 hypothetical protein GKZ67_06045 [Hymenobacter sp. BRD67]